MRRGIVLDGRYELMHVLGGGGYGEVWSARDQRMQREVAVKFLKQGVARRNEDLIRFRREIRAAAELPGRYTTVAHDWGEAEIGGIHLPYMVMERLPGPTLVDAVRSGGVPKWNVAVSWARQVAAALEAAHRRGIVHRDIKPHNVMFTEDGELKVLDFGIAKFFGDTVRESGLTLTGTPMGTPVYMSPEQAKGERTVDHRSDLYATGALLYFLLTGRAPFSTENGYTIEYQVIHHEPRPVEELAPRIPPGLAELVGRLLAKHPEDRPASATEVLALLDGFLAPATGAGVLEAVEREVRELREKVLREVGELRRFAESSAQRVRDEAEAAVAELLAQAEEDARAKRQEAVELFEETRDKAAQAAADFETNLAKRREQSERDLASRQVKAEKRLAEIEHRAEALRLEAEKLRTDAERRARTVMADARAEADEVLRGSRAMAADALVGLADLRTMIDAVLADSRYQPVGTLAEQRAGILRDLEALRRTLPVRQPPAPAPQAMAKDLGA
ncbi:protein kinase [Streptomyces sp. NPDC004520]|uniref:serine/threonine-protein kinase n=1 Tax=Streptomyces sp. NPDC004520 TaxID=3364702 RepID=UPI0036A4E4C2